MSTSPANRAVRWLGAGAFALALAAVPPSYADPPPGEEEALARQVAASVQDGKGRPGGEWGLVTDQMAILGLGQIVLEHPETGEQWIPVMERAAEHMMRPAQRDFATRAWGSDGLEHLAEARGDAWIGWADLALSMLRRVHPQTPFAAVNDRISDALARRLAQAPHALIETYPGQSFPTDVAACAAAVALHAQATGADRNAVLAKWARQYRAEWIDPRSGYLWQRGNARTGAHRDAPRGSGTAVAAYFLSFVDSQLSHDLTLALERHQRTVLGVSAVLEYAEGYSGNGDMDSGPVVFGTSVTATGFAIGAGRANGRTELVERMRRTARAFGGPTVTGDREHYAAAGPFGDAVMLAQLTARAPAARRPQ
jgi:hypothetical protein